MKILSTQQCNIAEIVRMIRREQRTPNNVTQAVKNILTKVRVGGDTSLQEMTVQFDGVNLKTLTVCRSEVTAAYRLVPKKVVTALQEAKKTIELFHTQTLTRVIKKVTTVPGVTLWREFRPIEKVGLYIPGGKAAYPSTVLMLGIPAKIAGCKEIVMCVPPLSDGTIPPAVLVAADLVGITTIFKVGGAQAIAAMAYGTKSIPKVSKVFGPGNQFVTTAKMLLFGEIAIDMPAGPSEVEVIADTKENPAWVAADLLSQLEHGSDSQALLVTFSEHYAATVMKEMERQMQTLSRKNIIEKAYKKSFAIIVKNIDEACDMTNEYAPEHLEIISEFESQILKQINNAGSIFLGKYSSEPLGDYATGANHTLPTCGFSKMFAPLSVESFGKMVQIQKVSKRGIANLRTTVDTLADVEGLDAHKNSITIRFI